MRRSAAGFTLVELMVSLVLGMIVTGAALAMFLSNKQVYATTENLARAQESVRTAYELMSRDMRESAATACEANLPTVNLLNSPGNRWYTNFDSPVRGYESSDDFVAPAEGTGTGFGQRIAGTDAVEVKSAVNDGVAITAANQPGATLTLRTADHGLRTGDIAMLCDFDHAAIVQLRSAGPTSTTISHGTGTVTPGNCTTGVGFSVPVNCTGSGTPHSFTTTAFVARMKAGRWYIGNGRTGPALFWAQMVNDGANGVTVERQEIAPGVRNMQLQYLLDGATTYVDASAVPLATWNTPNVLAVRVMMTVDGATPGQGGDTVTRLLEHTVTLRNRVP